MVDLTRIDVMLQTGSHQDAGTDGAVYLGLCGREFRCDTAADDFERDASRTYTFGEGANVQNRDANDPRKPRLLVEDAEHFPAYIRFEQGSSDHWVLERASVHLNGIGFPQYESHLGRDGLWLGKNAGAFCYLHPHIDGQVTPVADAAAS